MAGVILFFPYFLILLPVQNRTKTKKNESDFSRQNSTDLYSLPEFSSEITSTCVKWRYIKNIMVRYSVIMWSLFYFIGKFSKLVPFVFFVSKIFSIIILNGIVFERDFISLQTDIDANMYRTKIEVKS